MAVDLSGAGQFIFGGSTPWTYEQVQRQRAIADRLRAANAETPRNVGEGLSAIGRALGARRRENRAERRTGELRAEYEASPAYQAIFGALGGGQPQGGSEPYIAPQPNAPITEGPLPLDNPQGLPQSIVDAVNGADSVSRFNDGLSVTESGGNYGVVNSEGYTGKYQFGPARLQDYNTANNANVTMEEFRANPQLQEQVQRWHVGDIDNFVAQNGLDQYIGQTIGGVLITQDGLRAMAHLGGNAGMKRFLESGGQYNPSDSNGTSLADYAATHAGGGQPATMSADNRPPQGQQGQIDPRAIMQLMANPMATPEQKQYLGMLLQQQMATQQPDYDRYRVVDGQLVDLGAPGGPRPVEGISAPVDTSAPTVKQITRADGSEVAVQWQPDSSSPSGGSWIPIDAPEGGGVVESKTDLTEGQAKLTLFQNQMEETAPVLLDIEKQWDPSNLADAAARSTPIAGNFFQSSAGQAYQATAAVWAEGALRVATGAAATQDEIDRNVATYFAQPGDTPTTIAHKAQLRALYQRSIKLALGAGSVAGSLPTPIEFLEGNGGGNDISSMTDEQAREAARRLLDGQ
jgi:hypothetical protein